MSLKINILTKIYKTIEIFIKMYAFFSFRTLNFNNNLLLIGGLSSADPLLERPGQIHTDDLIGCVHSISINGRALNLSNPIKSRGIQSTCGRKGNGGPCSQGLPFEPTLPICGSFSGCVDRWHYSMCKCGGELFSPDCYNSLDPISLSEGGFLEFKISEKHRRMQLLDNFYMGSDPWKNDYGLRNRRSSVENTNLSLALTEADPPKSMSMLFKTFRSNGMIFYAATNKHYTMVELKNGKIVYQSKQGYPVNMTIHQPSHLDDGKWHNITLHSFNRIISIFIDGLRVGDELDIASVHDFVDPYLTVLSVGGARRELLPQENIPSTFEGCLANFTINNEIQPFNGSGSIFQDVSSRGKVYQGCHNIAGIGTAQTTDPLSIGITLVIVFFVILLVAILASFVVFRLRKQYKEKSGGPGVHGKHNGDSTLLAASRLSSGASDIVMGRGMHTNDPSVGFHADNSDIIRAHHLMGPELISKKYADRDLNSSEHQISQRPDIIEREVVNKSPPLPDEHQPPIPPPTQHHPHDHPSGVDLSEYPEHYDLENASSIAPSDIDIVYHYKGYREAGGVRNKYKPTSYTHHKHTTSQSQQQHRHSPHHVPYGARVQQQTSQPSLPPNTARQHQSTPLARLSPSSELSSQQPRILTLHDISGKPLQSALLATTSSSGGVGKDALHSNSERSLNSPVMSQLSGHSSASRTKPGQTNQVPMKNVKSVGSVPMGLTAEDIQRLSSPPRTSSLVSTLDAVSSSSEAPHVASTSHHLSHLHHSSAVDGHSSTSTDESGNDSFTCSEIEYDNTSMNGDKFPKNREKSDRTRNNENNNGNKPPPMPPSYDGFDSSFRGSLSTLVASDDDLSAHINNMHRQQNGASPSALGWDYLLNWGLNFEKLMGVFNDIAELPDNVNGMVPTLRLPTSVQKPSEEYV